MEELSLTRFDKPHRNDSVISRRQTPAAPRRQLSIPPQACPAFLRIFVAKVLQVSNSVSAGRQSLIITVTPSSVFVITLSHAAVNRRML